MMRLLLLLLSVELICCAVIVPNEVGRIITVNPLNINSYELYCRGNVEVENSIYWLRNGVRVDTTFNDTSHGRVRIIYMLQDSEEAYYYCNGIGIWVTREFPQLQSRTESYWRNSKLRCIDEVEDEARYTLTLRRKEIQHGEVELTTEVKVNKRKNDFNVPMPMFPIKEFIVENNMTARKCNGTEEFTFVSETTPTTSIEFKNKEVVCTSTDKEGRCDLTIWFGNKNVSTGKSPKHTHKYNKISMQDVRCTATCLGRDGDIVNLPVQNIEINRTLYIAVIFAIVIVILIIIVLICCVLCHMFGLKDKIQRRLKKNFVVEGLSGVEVGEDGDSEGPYIKLESTSHTAVPNTPSEGLQCERACQYINVKEFRDPNFGRTQPGQTYTRDPSMTFSSI